MSASDPRPVSAGWLRTTRRIAWPLSIALHGVLFYTAGLVPWTAADMPQPSAPRQQVVWLDDRSPFMPEQSARDPVEATAPIAEPEPPPEPAPPETREARVVPPPSVPRPAPVEPNRTRIAPTPTPATSTPPEAPAAPANEAEAATAATLPEVDWEKERKDAVHDVLERRATQREYLTFSLDDLVEEELEPVDPVPLPLVVDECVIVKGKLQRFAALMMGRCVREARGDLFAAIKPAYLKAHPVCIETRPDNPGSFLSDGRRISTVKCELVANEGEAR